MANWIRCPSFTNPKTTVYVNLDQIVGIYPTQGGSILKYAGSDSEMLIGQEPAAILEAEAVRTV